MKVRFINTGSHNLFYNLGLDQALAEIVSQSGVPVLRVFSTNSAAISAGYFQTIDEEVDINRCIETGTQISRRQTGGGLYFHHNCFEVSFIVPLDSDFVRPSISESRQDIEVAISKLGSLLDTDFEVNSFGDLSYENMLIGNSVQTRREGALRQNICLNWSIPNSEALDLLKFENERSKEKTLNKIELNFASLNSELGTELDYDKFSELVFDSFKSVFSLLKFENSEVTPTEEFLAKKYADEKYTQDSWKFKF